MRQNLLKLTLTAEIITETLDQFGEVVYLTMSDDAKNWRFQGGQNAEHTVNCILKLFWENFCCAIMNYNTISTSEVYLELNCAEFEGSFHWCLLKEENRCSGWTPALSAHIEASGNQLRQELTEMLCQLTDTYYTGAVVKAGEHYEFRLRY